MLDAPVDAWYVWIGLAFVAVTLTGVVTALPGAPPPAVNATVETVDTVAVSEYSAADSHPVPNTRAVRVTPDTLSLRGPGGTAHAAFGFGPVTPAAGDAALRAVLHGTPPERRFSSPAALSRRAAVARAQPPTWYRTERVLARHVVWEGTDVVLVG